MHIERQIPNSRRLSLTPLIDVIFLLLMFFMLTSTFTRYGDIEFVSSDRGGQSAAEAPQIFIRLDAVAWTVNGDELPEDDAIALLRRLEAEGARRAVIQTTAQTNTQNLVTALERIRRHTKIDAHILR